MGITVRELVTKFTIGGDAGAKLAKFGLAVNGVKAGLDILVGATRIAARATFGFVKSVAEQNDVIAKTARTLSITSDEYQRLSFSADRSGIAMKTMERGILNLNKGLAQAGTTTGKLFDNALRRLGVTMDDLNLLNTEERLGFLGEALKDVTDETQRTEIAQRIFGERAGPRLANLLREGEAGIRALGDEAEKLGFVLGEKTLAQSEAFVDSLTNINAVITGLKRSIVTTLIPGVKKGVEQFQKWIITNREFIKQKVTVVINTLSKAFLLLLANSDKIVEKFEAFVNVVSDIVSFIADMVEAVGGVTNVIRIATIAWIAYTVAQAAALGPIGLAVTALSGLAAWFITVGKSADAAREATDKFGKTTAEIKPDDKRQADRDAKEIVNRLTTDTAFRKNLRQRLISGISRETFANVFAQAEKDISSGIRRFRFKGRSESARRATNKKLKARLRVLKAIRTEMIEERRRIEAANARPARETTLSMLGIDKSSGRTSVPTTDTDADGKGAGDKTEKKSLGDLLAEAIASGQLPESAALLASTQPPIIIPITNNNITMEVEVNAPVTGVPGEDAESIGDRMVDIVQDALRVEFLGAIDQLRPRLAK